MTRTINPQHRPTRLGKLVDEYLLGLANPNTRRNHQADLRSVEACFRPWDGREDRLAVIEYIRGLERKLAPSSVRERVIRLRRFYQFLVEHGYRKAVPISLEYAPRVKDQRTPKCPTMEELRAVFMTLDTSSFDGLRDATMVSFMTYEALRVCEVAALRRSDLEDVGGSIQCMIRGKGGRLIHRFLWPQTERIVRHYLKAGTHSSMSAPLFYSLRQPGRGLSTRAIRKRVDHYFALAGVRKGLSCHSLRHAHATFLMSQGVGLTRFSRQFCYAA